MAHGLDGNINRRFNAKAGFLIERRATLRRSSIDRSGQLQQGDFRQYPHPARVTDKPETPVNIQFLVFLFVQPRPLLVHILDRAPAETRHFQAELHTMGMPRQHQVYIPVNCLWRSSFRSQ